MGSLLSVLCAGEWGFKSACTRLMTRSQVRVGIVTVPTCLRGGELIFDARRIPTGVFSWGDVK